MTEKKKKLIDEKGRLFGKLNVIDLIVIALILVAVLVVAVKFLGRGNGLPGGSSGTQIIYTTTVPRVPTGVYEAITEEVKLGGEHAQLMAKGEMLAGCFVTEISAVPHLEPEADAAGTLVASPEPDMLDVTFTIEATIQNPTTQQVGTQEVRIGKRDHIIKTKTFELTNGVIMTCQPLTPAQ
ncbi:MAG: DUF4330 domain-containing protein [Pseudoflavonifractor sp.]